MDILLACIGKSDPYTYGYDNKEIPGPILTLLEERDFDAVHLLWCTHKDMNQRATALRSEIRSRYGDRIAVNLNTFDAMDPTDLEILYARMSVECGKIRKQYREEPIVDYFIEISSGTPQMQMVWMVLRERGIMPATLISMRPRYYPGVNPPFAVEVDFSLSDHLGDGLLKGYEQRIQKLQMDNKILMEEIEMLKKEAGDRIYPMDDLPEGFNLTEYLRNEKRRYYSLAIMRYPDNASKAAKMLGLKPHTFRKEAEMMGIRSRRERLLQESRS